MGKSEIKISLGLRTSQNNMKIISRITIKPNPNPNIEMYHHFTGSKLGARQASRNTTEASALRITKIIFVKRR